MRKILSLVLTLCIIFTFAACGKEEKKVENTNVKMNFENIVEDEITLETKYSFKEYDITSWKILEDKDLMLEAKVKDVPENIDVLLDNVNIKVKLLSENVQLNESIQGEVKEDFSKVNGLKISKDTLFKYVFEIKGYSNQIKDAWSFAAGRFGTGAIIDSDNDLTETNLKLIGDTYANKIVIEYVIYLKEKTEENYHRVSIKNEIIIREVS